MTPATDPDDYAEIYVDLVRDQLTVDELVQLAQRAHTSNRLELRDDLHRWIGYRYAATASPTTTDTPYRIDGAA